MDIAKKKVTKQILDLLSRSGSRVSLSKTEPWLDPTLCKM